MASAMPPNQGPPGEIRETQSLPENGGSAPCWTFWPLKAAQGRLNSTSRKVQGNRNEPGFSI